MGSWEDLGREVVGLHLSTEIHHLREGIDARDDRCDGRTGNCKVLSQEEYEPCNGGQGEHGKRAAVIPALVRDCGC